MTPETEKDTTPQASGSVTMRIFVMAMGYVLLSDLLGLWLDTPLADGMSAFAWITSGYWLLPRRDTNIVEWVRSGVIGAVVLLTVGDGVPGTPGLLLLTLFFFILNMVERWKKFGRER